MNFVTIAQTVEKQKYFLNFDFCLFAALLLYVLSNCVYTILLVINLSYSLYQIAAFLAHCIFGPIRLGPPYSWPTSILMVPGACPGICKVGGGQDIFD